MTHRIVSIETNANGKQFVTKGDANQSPDPWRVPATGTGWKYQQRIPKLGWVFGYLSTLFDQPRSDLGLGDSVAELGQGELDVAHADIALRAAARMRVCPGK